MSYGTGETKWSWSGDESAMVANVTLALNGNDDSTVFSSDRSAKVHPRDAADPYVGAAISSARAFRDVADQLEAWAGLQLAGAHDKPVNWLDEMFRAVTDSTRSALSVADSIPAFRPNHLGDIRFVGGTAYVAPIGTEPGGPEWAKLGNVEEIVFDSATGVTQAYTSDAAEASITMPTPPRRAPEYDPNWATDPKTPKKKAKRKDKRIKPFTRAEAEGRGIHPDHWKRLGVDA